ncbi:MAG: hypothetical protein WC756_02045 [Taibaiella sp.]|jgi:hypothetical protein
MILKIINTILMLFAFFMAAKQGWAMITGKQAMLDMFGKWNIGTIGVMAFGIYTILASVLMLFPKTFIWGNFLLAAGILLIIAFQVKDHNLKGAAIEIPFLLLSLVIIYLQHPLAVRR